MKDERTERQKEIETELWIDFPNEMKERFPNGLPQLRLVKSPECQKAGCQAVRLVDCTLGDYCPLVDAPQPNKKEADFQCEVVGEADGYCPTCADTHTQDIEYCDCPCHWEDK